MVNDNYKYAKERDAFSPPIGSHKKKNQLIKSM